MATTPNWNVVYPVVGTTMTPLANHFANLANSTDTALSAIRGATTYTVANAAARDSLYPSPSNGNRVFRLDTLAIEIYNGSWKVYDTKWNSWTPTWNGITIGNGSQEHYHRRSGDKVELIGRVLLGSTSSVSANISLTLPFNAAAALGGSIYFDANFIGGANRGGVFFAPFTPVITDLNKLEFLAIYTGSAHAAYSGLGTAYSWGPSTAISYSGAYRI